MSKNRSNRSNGEVISNILLGLAIAIVVLLLYVIVNDSGSETNSYPAASFSNAGQDDSGDDREPADVIPGKDEQNDAQDSGGIPDQDKQEDDKKPAGIPKPDKQQSTDMPKPDKPDDAPEDELPPLSDGSSVDADADISADVYEQGDSDNGSVPFISFDNEMRDEDNNTHGQDSSDGGSKLFEEILAILLLIDLCAIAGIKLAVLFTGQKKDIDIIVPEKKGITTGSVHNIGKRPNQQDSFGIQNISDGIFAVVADGMGGLADGERVSQKVVSSMMNYASDINGNQMDGMLNWMVQNVNIEVNQMLGAGGLYKSGSTLISVLVRNMRFHWISVGDSRIYLYRNGGMLQLNREHVYGQELLNKAMNGDITFNNALSDPGRGHLTSFIGMGKLKYIDYSTRSIALEPGDRILLLSDGIFNTLSEQRMAEILSRNPNVNDAALEFEENIILSNIPKQDNFTAVIIEI